MFHHISAVIKLCKSSTLLYSIAPLIKYLWPALNYHLFFKNVYFDVKLLLSVEVFNSQFSSRRFPFSHFNTGK